MERRKVRVRLIGAITAAFLIVGGVALADTTQTDGDIVTPSQQSLDFGTVCANDSKTVSVQTWARTAGRGGANNNNNWDNSALLTASVGAPSVDGTSTATGTTLAPTLPTAPGNQIQLPSDWLTFGNGIDSAKITGSVELNAGGTPGTFTGTIPYTLTGSGYLPPNATLGTLARVGNLSFSAMIEDCVNYVTNGFRSPVLTGDWNKARAGQSASLRWNLWENTRSMATEVIDPELNGDSYSISSVKVTCPTMTDPTEDLQDADDAGKSGLRYDYDAVVDDASGQNVFVWQTNKNWDKTCRKLTIKYDSSDSDPPLVAFFDFRK